MRTRHSPPIRVVAQVGNTDVFAIGVGLGWVAVAIGAFGLGLNATSLVCPALMLGLLPTAFITTRPRTILIDDEGLHVPNQGVLPLLHPESSTSLIRIDEIKRVDKKWVALPGDEYSYGGKARTLGIETKDGRSLQLLTSEHDPMESLDRLAERLEQELQEARQRRAPPRSHRRGDSERGLQRPETRWSRVQLDQVEVWGWTNLWGIGCAVVGCALLLGALWAYATVGFVACMLVLSGVPVVMSLVGRMTFALYHRVQLHGRSLTASTWIGMGRLRLPLSRRQIPLATGSFDPDPGVLRFSNNSARIGVTDPGAARLLLDAVEHVRGEDRTGAVDKRLERILGRETERRG